MRRNKEANANTWISGREFWLFLVLGLREFSIGMIDWNMYASVMSWRRVDNLLFGDSVEYDMRLISSFGIIQ